MGNFIDKREFWKNETFFFELCHDVINLAATGVFLASVDGKLKMVNQTGCEMFGYTQEEMLDLFVADLIQQDDLKQNPLHLEELKVGSLSTAERRLKRKDGSEFVAEIQGQKLPGGLILGILRNITEEKEIKESLQLAEDRYRRIFEAANEGIWGTDENDITVFVNGKMAAMLGYAIEEMIGKPSEYFMFPEDLDDHSRRNQVRQSGKSEQYERCFRKKDGRSLWALISAAPDMDEDGIFRGSIAMLTDITDQKLSEAALRESEESYRLLYQRSPLGYQSLDADGNFLEVNDAWLGTLGYSREEVIGHWFGEFLPPPMVVAFRERFPKFKIDGEVHNQFQMVRKDGKTITVAFDGKIGHDRAGHFKQTHCVLRDITEQQRLQDALRDSEERYRTVADYAMDWETWIDPEGKYQYCSPSCEQITGYPPEKFIEAPEFILSLVHPDDREIVEEHFAEEKKDRQESTIIYRIHRNDGQVRWIEHNCRSVFSKDGSFLGVRGNDRDVTNRKLAEKALYESEERYRRLTDHAPDIIFRYDLSPTMKLVYINPAVQTITGYSPEECTADPALMLNMVHPDDRDQMNAMLQDLNVPEEGFTLRWIGKDGVTRWMESRIVPMRDEAGQLLAVEGIARDLTDRIKMQEDLARSESLYRSLVENASNGVLIVQDGVYQYANPAALKLLDRDASEIPGLPIAETIHPESLAIMKKRSEKVLLEGAPNPPTAMKIIRPDGKVIISESTSVPVSFGGKPAAMVIGQDVTERIHAENALETSEHFLDRAQKIARLGNWTFDLLTNERTWSDGLYEIYGCEKQENDNILELWLKTVHPDDKQLTIDLEEKFLAGESDYDIEYRIIRHDDQEVRTIHATAELIRNDKGVPIQVVGVAQDITERKREEEETASAKAKLEAALDSMTDAVFISDINGTFVNFNEAFATFHKFKGKDEMFEKLDEYPAFIEVYLPDGELATLDQWAVSRALRGETVINAEYTLRRKDTGETWIGSYNFAPILNNVGVTVGSVVTARDITKRKKAEEALKESELRFRTLFEHAAVGVALIETATGRYIDINQKYCDFLGYTKAEMLDSTFQDVTFSADRAANVENNRMLLSGEIREFSIEKRYIRKDGTIVWGELTASPLWAPGDTPPVYLHIAIVVDITERKQAEEALRKSEESLKKAQKVANIGNWTWHVPTNRLEWSDQMYHIFGIDKTEFSGDLAEVMARAIHPDDMAAVEASNLSVIQRGKPIPLEYRVVLADGTQRVVWAEAGELTLDEEGRPFVLTGIVQDITERKKADQELQASEDKYRSLVQKVNIGLVAHGPDTRILFANPRASQLLGLTLAQLLGKSAIDPAWHFIREDGTRMPLEEYPVNQALAADDPLSNLTLGILRPDREGTTWVQCNAHKDCDKDGKLLQVIVSFTDITESKLAEELLRESEEKFRYMFEAANVGKSITSLSGEIMANKAFTEMLGYRQDELVGKTWQMLTPPDEVEQIQAKLSALLNSKEDAVRFDKRYIQKDGSTIWADVSTVIRRDSDGNPLHFITTVINITERKRAEEALRKSEERFKKLFSEAPLGISVTDSLTGKFIDVNPMYAEIAGRTIKEMTALSWMDITHPDDVEKDAENMALLNAGKISGFQMEKRYLLPDGTPIWINMTITPIEMEDKSLRWHLCMIEDITGRKQMEMNLQEERNSLARRVEERTAELSSANIELMKALQTKDEFLANMSHELRTPLTAILGISEILEMGLRGPMNAAQVKGVQTIQESGEHLLALINDILDISKIEAGKLEIEPDLVVIDDICQASLSLVKGMAHSKNLSLVYNISDPQLRICADARRLKQIVVNLLSNAVKFTPEGGRVSLDVELEKQHERVKFVVQDNGIGISEEDIGKLFQAFTQLDSSLSRQYEGSGLGLALVRRLVELHQGEVFVESEGISGKGSRFTVLLPWEEPHEKKPALPPDAPEIAVPVLAKTGQLIDVSRNQEYVILLAEDNPTNIITISEYLKLFGYQIIHARDGSEAVKVAAANAPDLILMDIQMPVMDGLEAMRCLRQEAKFRETPIIALTALAMQGDRERCFEAGASDYVTKPVNMKDLLTKINASLYKEG